MARRAHHSVYVIKLDDAVLNERKFREANPQHHPLKPCVYVGSTGVSPERRFAQHKRGYKANRYVELYGVRLLPELYEPYNPMPYRDAVEQETFLANELRHQGLAVWQH